MLKRVVVAAALVAAFGACANADGQRYGIDSTHSVVVFGLGHMGVARMYGTFHAPTGSYAIDFANPSASSIEVSIDAEKVDTGNSKRDDHLRNPDFFNAKEFPTITFKGTSFEKTGEKTMKVKGDLTMIGVTKPVEATLEWIGAGETMQGMKSGIEARFSIKRSDFGMTKYLEKDAIGDQVTLIVALEGKKE